MRLLGLILVMVMISTSSQSSEKRDFTRCSEIAKSMNIYLGQHSSELGVINHLMKTDKSQSDSILEMIKAMDRSLTTASKYATIFIAKCK